MKPTTKINTGKKRKKKATLPAERKSEGKTGAGHVGAAPASNAAAAASAASYAASPAAANAASSPSADYAAASATFGAPAKRFQKC